MTLQKIHTLPLNAIPIGLTVTAKIRSLYDCQLRLMHNIQPLPSGVDIANTVKYFSQTLLSKYKYTEPSIRNLGMRHVGIHLRPLGQQPVGPWNHCLPTMILSRTNFNKLSDHRQLLECNAV